MTRARGLRATVGAAVALAVAAACAPAAPAVDPASVSLAALCDKRCACEHCHSDERGLCAADAKNTPALARRSHCGAELDAWVRCERETATCLSEKWIEEGCEKQHAALNACTGR